MISMAGSLPNADVQVMPRHLVDLERFHPGERHQPAVDGAALDRRIGLVRTRRLIGVAPSAVTILAAMALEAMSFLP